MRELSLELPETITSKDPVVAQARLTYQDGTREQLRGEQPFQLTPNDLAKLGKQGAVSAPIPRARRAYQDFLALWKDADPDVPVLIEARAEYAKLPPS